MRRKVINVWFKQDYLEETAELLLEQLNLAIDNEKNKAELVNFNDGGLALIGTETTNILYNKLMNQLSELTT